jgi:hypothetical protein
MKMMNQNCQRSVAAAVMRPVLLMLTALLALSACGSSQYGSPPSDPVAAVAWSEWRRFGGELIVYGGAGGHGGGIKETSEPLSSRIGDYWALVGRPEWNGRSGKPWSGIFVAWVMDQAGVSRRDFPPNGRHAGFLASLLDAQLGGSARRFFVHDWRDYSPKSGDLICAGTRWAPRRDAYALRAAVAREVAHCDVVIEAGGGRIRAIGGNVHDTVTMSVFALGSGGRLAEVRGRPWFAIVEKRG